MLTYLDMRDSIELRVEQGVLHVNLDEDWADETTFDGLSVEISDAVAVERAVFHVPSRTFELPMTRVTSKRLNTFILIRPWRRLDRSALL